MPRIILCLIGLHWMSYHIHCILKGSVAAQISNGVVSAGAPTSNGSGSVSAGALADTPAQLDAPAAVEGKVGKPAAVADKPAAVADVPKVAEWPWGELDTIEAAPFYLDVARAGIQYGPAFQMVRKLSGDGSAVVLRCLHSTITSPNNRLFTSSSAFLIWARHVASLHEKLFFFYIIWFVLPIGTSQALRGEGATSSNLTPVSLFMSWLCNA